MFSPSCLWKHSKATRRMKKRNANSIFEKARRPEDIWNHEPQHRWNGCKKHWRSCRGAGAGMERLVCGATWISKRTSRVPFSEVRSVPRGTKSKSLVSSTRIRCTGCERILSEPLLVQRGSRGKTDQGIKPNLHEAVCLSGGGRCNT